MIYFDLIAGRSEPFGVRDAFHATKRRAAVVGTPKPFKTIGRYLYRLRDAKYIYQLHGDGFASFAPTDSGAWW